MTCAFISTAPFAVATWLAIRNYDPDLRQIVYAAKGHFEPAFIAAIVGSIIPGMLGLVFGWNSAGKRRNDKPARSWIGFFVGGGVMTMDLVLLIAFFMLRLKHPG